MWDGDDDFCGFKELALANAKKTYEMLLSFESKMYQDENFETAGTKEHEGTNDSPTTNDHLGLNEYWPSTAPPPLPCHLEWQHFKNLRIRGVGIARYSESATQRRISSTENVDSTSGSSAVKKEDEEDKAEEIFAAHGSPI